MKEGECGVGEGLGENIRHVRPELEEQKWMQRVKCSGHTGGRENRRCYGLAVRYEEKDDSSVTQHYLSSWTNAGIIYKSEKSLSGGRKGFTLSVSAL